MTGKSAYRTHRIIERPPTIVSSGQYSGSWEVGDSPSEGSGKGARRQVEEILDLFVRRKWIVILTFAVMVAVAALYSSIQEPFYMASSFIMVDLQGEQGGSGESGIMLEDNSFFARNDRPLSDELFVLENSHDLVRRVVQRLQEFAESDNPPPLPILYRDDGRRLDELQLTSRLRQRIDFGQVRESKNLVEVEAVSSEPIEAAILANIYAREYVELTEEARTARLTRSREFLQEQLERRSEELQQMEDRLEEYLRANGSAGGEQEAAVLSTQIADLEGQLDEARMNLELTQGNIRSLERQILELDDQIVESISSGLEQDIENLQKEIGEMKAAKMQIEERYPDPEQRSELTRNELDRMQREIDALQERLVALAEKFVNSGAGGDTSGLAALRRDLIAERSTETQLRARIELLEKRVKEARAELRNVPQQTVERARLERSRASAERMVQLVSEQLLNTRLAGEAQRATGYVRVVREAGMGMPSPKQTARNLLMGALLGIMLGLGLAIISDKLDNRIFNPEQLRDHGYAEIGMIPDMRPQLKKSNGFKDYNGRKMSTSLVAVHDPSSVAAEAFRFIRTNLQFRLTDSSTKTLLVTSPNVGDGKSVTVANLAMFLSRAGHKTLLLDADLRRPRVHELFGLQSRQGLVELLLDEKEIEDVEMKVSNLSVIPAGNIYKLHRRSNGTGEEVLGADELLGSVRLQDLLDILRDRFDVILIDSPPVLAATDAALLSRACDSTVIVTRAGTTKEGEIDSAIDILTGAGAAILGVLLNGFDVSMAYGYKYRYQNYSRYGIGDHHDFADFDLSTEDET